MALPLRPHPGFLASAGLDFRRAAIPRQVTWSFGNPFFTYWHDKRGTGEAHDMDISLHALTMAALCSRRFADLILAVPASHANYDVAMGLISLIANADTTARMCRSDRAREMIAVVAGRALFESNATLCEHQHEGARSVIVSIMNADLAAMLSPGQTAKAILDLVRPLADQSLPVNRVELGRLRRHEQSIDSRIRSMS
jgi:hypothetical protein